MSILEEIRKCIAFVGYEDKVKGGFNSAGTAFFISMESKKPNENFIYVVTARHVIDGMKNKGVLEPVLRINAKDDSYKLVKTPIGKWSPHCEDPSVDVAILQFAPPTEICDYATISLPKMVANEKIIESESIGAGHEIFLAGVFVHHSGKQRNLPVIRTGNIALMPEEPISTESFGDIDAYLVESRSIGGLSGSPVFVKCGGLKGNILKSDCFYFLGLMHGHWDKTEEIQKDSVMDTVSKEIVNMGMAIVVPSTKILEAIRALNKANSIETKD